MNQLAFKIFKNKYFCHGMIFLTMVVFTVVGWMMPLMILYIVYLLFCFARLINLIVKDTKIKWQKYCFAFVLCFGLAPGFAVGLIPLWFISVVHLQNDPEIKENLPEYKVLHGTLRNVSYFYNYRWTAWEGDIGEQAFLKMARHNNWEVQPFSKPHILDKTAAELIRQHRHKKQANSTIPRSVDISSGYEYDRRQPNGGGINVIWAKDRQRLYILSNPR